MKKRITSLALIFILLATIVPINALAVEETIINQNIITFEDGSSLTIALSEAATRATNTKTGRNTYIYRAADGTEVWRAVLIATFTYTGTSSTCTSASCTVTVTSSNWYEISKSTTRSGNTATTELTMGQKFVGITINTHDYTITLSCDKDGNLS